MAIQINKLTNCNVYVDGTNFIGRAEEVNLPEVVQKMADHKALGLIGEVEFWSGGIEKMSSKIKWGSFYRDAYVKCVDPTKAPKFMVRGALQSHNADGLIGTVPYVVYFNGTPKKIPTGNFKHLDNAEFESEITVNYVKVEVDGAEVLEIDVLSGIYKVEGVDILASYKSALGI